MNENELLLLGLLVNQSQHGYQINEVIEKEFLHLINMKKGNAYAILERLCKDGFVSMRMEQEGNRPLRKVYTITAEGKEQFYRLLRGNLSNSERLLFAGNVGLMFLDYLPTAEVAERLKARLEQVKTILRLAENHPRHQHGQGVNFAFEHSLHMYQAEAEWLEEAIEKLRQEVNRAE